MKLVSFNAIHNTSFKLMTYPPNSPDLAPGDFDLYQNMKDSTQEQQSEIDDAVLAVV